ncbi:MAG TPA: tetratricopeptide repeat protein, partial [Thermomicrobiales bacterium]|nr:tetratricopeptide repeat protein [Thermomicrobiales bacterium]
GGWLLVAAAAVAGEREASAHDVLDGIGLLVDHSLVRRSDDQGEPRFTMLETIREYAAERLGAIGQVEATRRRHAAHYLALAEAARGALTGAAQGAWVARLAREHANLRAALAWALAAEAATALRLAAALWRFWAMHGDLDEGRRALAAALAAAGDGADGVARGEALFGAGVLALQQADYAAAQGHLAARLPLARGAGDAAATAATLTQLGHIAFRQGRYGPAREVYGEGLTLWRGLDDRRGGALALNGLGSVALALGECAEAATRYEESLALFREQGDWDQVGITLCWLGRTRAEEGDVAAARVHYAESLALYERLDKRHGSALPLLELGDLAHRQGDDREALERYRASLARFRVAGSTVRIVRCLEGFAGTLTALGRAAPAARLFGAAGALRAGVGAPLQPIERAAHDRDVAAARAALGEAAFAAAQAAGAALPLDRALDEALGPEVEDSRLRTADCRFAGKG